jgi:hypothetical protein
MLSLLAAPAVAQPSDAPQLSETRLLRRITLRLLNRPPTHEEYEALLATPTAGRAAFVERALDRMLASDEFRDALVAWGLEYFRVAEYLPEDGPMIHNRLIDLAMCGEGTPHAGAFHTIRDGDAICTDASAPVRTLADPWFDPGGSVRLVGDAGNEAINVRDAAGTERYCGDVMFGGSVYNVQSPYDGCGCGPHAVFCDRMTRGYEDTRPQVDHSLRRSIMEEPARLFAHVVAEDRPYSDLVTGDYTVVDQGVFAIYRAQARYLGDRDHHDDTWFTEFPDPTEWREVKISRLNRFFLDERDYRFDPRTEAGSPRGVPSAGVLTMAGTNSTFPRERVRAARWMEIFACKEFNPPSPDIAFDPYQTDPAREGSCQHCHQGIDPAAVFFKRFQDRGSLLAGIGPMSLSSLDPRDDTRERAEGAFVPNTLMTPITDAQAVANPDARLIDFLADPDATLLGERGDGTIGPLGFGKILIESGAFDACAVRNAYERFGGRELDPGLDARRIAMLASDFATTGRSMRALIRRLLVAEEARLGY